MSEFGEGVRLGDEPAEHHEVRAGGRGGVRPARPAFPWHVLAHGEVLVSLIVVALAVWMLLHL